jgi:hypothetical protein
MNKILAGKGIIILTGVCCLAILCGCEVSTSSVSEPALGVYETDPVTGRADVPFEGSFWRYQGTAPVDINTITVHMLKPGGWPTDPPIYDYPSTNEYGFNLDGPTGSNGLYTVSGTMPLTPGNYQLTTKCWPQGFPMPGTSYFSNGSDTRSFTVKSGFDPENYTGGVQTFGFLPDINGTCFWISGLGTVGMSFELLVAVIMKEMIDADPMNFPGWSTLPQTIDLVTEDLPIPQVAATFSQGTGQIDVDIPGTIDVTLAEEDWMYYDLRANPDPVLGGEYFICGYRFSFDNPGALLPIGPDEADLELNFVNMALRVADAIDGVPVGDCLVRTAPSVVEMTSPFDAQEACGCSVYYIPF